MKPEQKHQGLYAAPWERSKGTADERRVPNSFNDFEACMNLTHSVSWLDYLGIRLACATWCRGAP